MRERAPRGFLHYLRSFYYDTALSGNEFALSALTKLVPNDHILFGSDFPFAPVAVGAASAKGVADFDGFDDEDRKRIGTGNATRLFNRLKAPVNED